MKNRGRMKWEIGIGLLAAFGLWTVAVCLIEVQPIGPDGSSVGFASLNAFVHRAIGVRMALYTVTDWLGLVPIGFAFGFAVLGLIQLIRRKSLLQVDHSLLVLGGFYLVVMAAYLLFEEVVVNYRPVLINGNLEASYPSSTTLLVCCVIPTAMMQLNGRIHNRLLRQTVLGILAVFTAFMVVGRLLSGVHWLTDIIGGVLLSAGLVVCYSLISADKITG